MIKKKFLPVRSTAPSSNPSRNAQPSKTKNSSLPEKKQTDSSLENVYRLPSSLKRTEDMINHSILQRQISSTILDIVGNTFRVKNANINQGQYFCSPTNFSQFLKYKEYASSEFLDTLYEVDGEESLDNSIQCEDMSEALELSICDEGTRREEDEYIRSISRTYSSSFSQTLNKTTSHSSLSTLQNKQLNASAVSLKSSISTQMPLSAGRTNPRSIDPWRQIKEALASKETAYGHRKDIKKSEVENPGEINTIKTQRGDKKKTSTIQRELMRDLERMERKVKKFTEKENVTSKNKSISIPRQSTVEVDQVASEENKINTYNTLYFTDQSEDVDVQETMESSQLQAQLEDEHDCKKEEKALQQNTTNTENKKTLSNAKNRSTKSLTGSEKNLKILPVANGDSGKGGFWKVKSPHLESRKSMEFEAKTKMLTNRK